MCCGPDTRTTRSMPRRWTTCARVPCRSTPSRAWPSTPASSSPMREPGAIICLLARLHANKAELLMALRRPEVPLHTNGSENDVRCQVTRRKISAGTRSDDGRDSRDAFLSLLKTCRKLGVSFWDYLGDRFGAAGAPAIPYLPDLVIARAVPP